MKMAVQWKQDCKFDLAVHIGGQRKDAYSNHFNFNHFSNHGLTRMVRMVRIWLESFLGRQSDDLSGK